MENCKIISIVLIVINLFLFLYKGKIVNAEVKGVVINEVMYNPVGTDKGKEWIELYNTSNETLSLDGWSIEKGGKSFQPRVIIESSKIGPYEFFTICERDVENCDYYTDSLNLENGGTATDGVRILDKDGNVIDTLLYDSPNSNNLPGDNETNLPHTGKTKEGYTLGRISSIDTDDCDKDFRYLTPTLGKHNLMNEIKFSEIILNNNSIELESNIENADYTGYYIYSSKQLNDKIDIQFSENKYIVISVSNNWLESTNSCLYLASPDDDIIDTVCYTDLYIDFSYCLYIGMWNHCTSTEGEKNAPYNPNIIDLANYHDREYFDSEICIFPTNNREYLIISDPTYGFIIEKKIVKDVISDYSTNKPYSIHFSSQDRNSLLNEYKPLINWKSIVKNLSCDSIIFTNPASIKDKNRRIITETFVLIKEDDSKIIFGSRDLNEYVSISKKYFGSESINFDFESYYTVTGLVNRSSSGVTGYKYEIIPISLSSTSIDFTETAETGKSIAIFYSIISLLFLIFAIKVKI